MPTTDSSSNSASSSDPHPPTTPFHSIDAFLAARRVSGLALSPDGGRLVTTVAELSADGTRYLNALWELDPRGERPARRLTRSTEGESAPGFRADGTLLFLSARPAADPGKGEADEEETALWALSADGGEAQRLMTRPGGVGGYVAARGSDRLAFVGGLLPGAEDAARDAELRKARKEAKVSAVLHESPLVRFWDHDLGPGVPHVFSVAGADLDAATGTGSTHLPVVDCGPGNRFEQSVAVSPDGTLVAYAVQVPLAGGDFRDAIVVADAATGKEVRRIDADNAQFTSPVFTADSRSLLCLSGSTGDWEQSADATLWLVADATDPQDHGHDITPGFDNWPAVVVPSPVAGDGTVFFVADELGHSPVFRLDTAEGTVTRLTASGAYTDLCVSPDGATLYALRSAVDAPPTPVRLDAVTVDQTPATLPTPADVGAVPGRLVEVHTTAEDGQALRAWLVLPEHASPETPAPFLLWVHGGPQASWNAWTWRWNPWVFAAAGYAVLLPDPALSTGYGQHMHARGWGDWGGTPYRDVMALTDAALEHEAVDATRTAMMGGSFGGYMANWIATRTDRFKAIVTHASLWNLESFGGTTDAAFFWRRHFGDPLTRPERHLDSSPHRAAAQIRTPMLVVHGDKDYRVPIGEGLALWNELARFEIPAKFLYFPDEGHWILKPNNAKVWYSTVLAFLAHHVLGEEWQRPELV
ncbi:S9 family peptidase [Streptacidiphilus jiangxiensis]|uniref:Dipeptidyl aminopeptidase/acylaminoacyl peptidase n=1 Tax=Streptacidiphilus jiangxiensis TaxID=235985 RepID=A0A1H7XLK6_STRJI|nr:S9 family peptidase [Streptacidiphilus jiangxiensis]SEM34631.1 Dipeptidyl aminopeptidase/acylaminoacyl peptidase [Streptacidiphilus jiangxiensis]